MPTTLRAFAVRSLALTALSAITIPTVNAVDIKMYGTVNKAYMGYSDGITRESTIVDNNNESTRIGVGGEQKLDNGLTASVLLEMEQNSNASNALTQNTTPGQSATPSNTTAGLNERIARVGLSNEYGAIFIGQQDLASDDAFVHDLTAATSVLNANVAAFGGGLVFRTKSGALVAPGGTNLTTTLFAQGSDGTLLAADAIRVNTATFNGVNGSLSVAQGGNVDANIRYAGEFGAFTLDSALGYTFVNNGTTAATNELTGQTFGSVSVKHNSGLGATLAYAGQSLDNKSAGVDEARGYYGKVGYAFPDTPLGIAAEYGKFKNPIATAADQELDVVGVGAEYDLGHGVTTGALYRNLSADVAGVSGIEDIDVYTVSMRVKF